MTTILKRVYKFNAAHHLNDGSICQNLHGHNYVLIVFVRQPSYTSPRSIIIPFSELDAIVDPVVELLDHHTLIGSENIANRDVMWNNAPEQCVRLNVDDVSTERLAEWFADKIGNRIMEWNEDTSVEMPPIQLFKIEVWETDRNGAEVYVNDPF